MQQPEISIHPLIGRLHTLGDHGTIIDSNAYRYVEFWAGSGM